MYGWDNYIVREGYGSSLGKLRSTKSGRSPKTCHLKFKKMQYLVRSKMQRNQLTRRRKAEIIVAKKQGRIYMVIDIAFPDNQRINKKKLINTLLRRFKVENTKVLVIEESRSGCH